MKGIKAILLVKFISTAILIGLIAFGFKKVDSKLDGIRVDVEGIRVEVEEALKSHEECV